MGCCDELIDLTTAGTQGPIGPPGTTGSQGPAGAATSYTIRTYTSGSQYVQDEIVLIKQNGVIKILSKIIHV